MGLFTKQPKQTLEEEHHIAVNDLVSLIKLQGQAWQKSMVEKTEQSKRAVENYDRMIHALQVRLVKLGDKINRKAEQEAIKKAPIARG